MKKTIILKHISEMQFMSARQQHWAENIIVDPGTDRVIVVKSRHVLPGVYLNTNTSLGKALLHHKEMNG